MIEISDLQKLSEIAKQSLETNKELMVDLRYHQELVGAMADFLVKLSQSPNMPVESLVQISMMMKKISNFQTVFFEKIKKDLTWR